MITQEENLRLQLEGANARALGKSQFENPFHKSEAMPGATGEDGDLWNAKQEAWTLGWTVENAMRPD